MRVGCPGICLSIAHYQMGACWSRCRPYAKCAIHMHPRPCFMGTRNELMRRVERSGIDIARLRTDNRGAADGRKSVGAYASLAVYWHPDHTLSPETQHAK